jgi:hypothetical protein
MLEERVEARDQEEGMQEERAVSSSSAAVPRFASLIVALLVFIGLFGYSVHERNVAEGLAQENEKTAATLKDTRGQMDALNAKLDVIASAQQAAPVQPAAVHSGRARVVARHGGKPDPRWKKFQNQLDAQGKQIDDTRSDLVSTRTELQGSIAKTHDELVVLQRKGERAYYEFDIDKSKQFAHAGPVGISLRKANTKHQFADLELMVDDRQMSKKHLNLYEPATFYPGEEQRPLELVINSISKNHIHGYISGPKYRQQDLTAMSGGSAAPEVSATIAGTSSAPPQLRRR